MSVESSRGIAGDNEIRVFLYQPRHVGLAVVATLRVALPPTRETQLSDRELLLQGDLGEPLATLRHALAIVERYHPAWRQAVDVHLVNPPIPREL
jgi:hypothetical protein